MEIWQFEVARDLETMAMTKAWSGLGGLPKKSVSWNLISVAILEGHLIL